jgi:N-acetylglucosamine-6-phosphate deacetylase
MELRIRADAVYTPYTVLHDAVLTIRNGVVASLRGSGPYDVDRRGYSIAPGYIDTHTHGCCGIDFTNAASIKDLAELARGYLKFGVTSLLPTTVSAKHERILGLLGLVKSAGDLGGARILGVNLEGPYINRARRGAQDPEAIRDPNPAEVRQYLSYGVVRVMTLAPELPGALEVVEELASAGVIASVGHTDADYATTKSAVAAGASRATHLFNAMREFHHREPGPVGALLEAEDVYLELIVDLIHLRPEAVRLVLGSAGHRRVVLITDSMAAAGLGEGEFKLGGVRVIVKGNKATLEDGTLAGSVLTLDKAVKNVASLGVEPKIAIAMASRVPALSIGRPDLGCLKPGCIADFVVLEGLDVVETYVGGENKMSILK